MKSSFNTALRRFRRRPGYTALNVVGLAIGMACALLALTFVAKETSYDRFYANTDRLFRLQSIGEDGEERAASTWIAGETLRSEYGHWADLARLRRWGDHRTIRRGDRSFLEEDILAADPSVFDVLELKLLEGDPRRALREPDALVLTETKARKYFGKEDPLGQTLYVDDRAYTVTGVVGDRPTNTHLRFGFLVSMHPEGMWRNDAAWAFTRYHTYLRLHDSSLAPRLEKALTERAHEASPEGATASKLLPIADVHLYTRAGGELHPGGSPAALYVYSAIAAFILLIACINFVNLSTARAADRAREVGVRKTLGAGRSQLVRQFVGEAVLLAALAGVMGLVLAHAGTVIVSQLVGEQIALSDLGLPWLAVALAVLVLGVGIAAGSYPAFYLSAFEPVRALKGRVSSRSGAATLRQGLVAVQFVISSLLLVATLVISNQLDYLRHAELGVDQERILIVEVGNNDKAQANYGLLKAELERRPSVDRVTATSSVPGRGAGRTSFRPEGFPPGDSLLPFRHLIVAQDFVATYGLEMLEGRDFSPESGTDFDEAFLVNEKAAVLLEGMMGWETPVDQGLQLWSTEGRIVGVVNDFNFAPLREEVEPLVIDLANAFNFLSVRLDTEDVPRSLAEVEEAWEAVLPDEPLQAYFLDDDFERAYRSEVVLRQMVRYFSVLAAIVACLGLLGLAAYTAGQRSKEVAVRKVLGASSVGLVLLVTKEFLKPVALAFVVAVPLGYVVMARWLESFAYRAPFSTLDFVLAGALTLAVAMLTVSYHAGRVALSDPVRHLRHE